MRGRLDAAAAPRAPLAAARAKVWGRCSSLELVRRGAMAMAMGLVVAQGGTMAETDYWGVAAMCGSPCFGITKVGEGALLQAGGCRARVYFVWFSGKYVI